MADPFYILSKMKILAAFNFHEFASSAKIAKINRRWNFLFLQYIPYICTTVPASWFFYYYTNPSSHRQPIKWTIFACCVSLKLTSSRLPTTVLLTHTHFTKLFQQMRTEQNFENEFVMKQWASTTWFQKSCGKR